VSFVDDTKRNIVAACDAPTRTTGSVHRVRVEGTASSSATNGERRPKRRDLPARHAARLDGGAARGEEKGGREKSEPRAHAS
jgi:hypothetical protein